MNQSKETIKNIFVNTFNASDKQKNKFTELCLGNAH